MTNITSLSPRVLWFLTHLEANNSKLWMDERRDFYHDSKQEVLDFGQWILDQACRINTDFEGISMRTCIFRINRDIRFSKNKQPYKNHFALYISPGGTKSPYAWLYLHIQPGDHSIIWWGKHNPDNAQLKLMRQHILDNYQEFTKIISHKKFVSTFGNVLGKWRNSLPRGYDKEHPWIHYLMQDSWYVIKSYTDEQLTSEWFAQQVISDYRILKPFNDFCNEIVDASTYS